MTLTFSLQVNIFFDVLTIHNKVMLRITLILIFAFITDLNSSYVNTRHEILPNSDEKINILSYNVWGLPVWLPKVGINNRFDKITKSLSKGSYDIICLQECFSKRFRTKARENILPHYYHTKNYMCNRKSLLGIKNDCHGGLMTISKFPIIEEDFYPYPILKKMKVSERIGKKGFLVSKIVNQESDTICIINTHLYAGKKSKDEKFRFFQISYLDSILHSQGYYEFTCLLIGDINVEHPSISQTLSKENSPVYNYITDEMMFSDTAPELSSHDYTIDHRRNSFCNKKDGLQKLDYIFHKYKHGTNWRRNYTRCLYTEELSYSDHLAWNVEFSY